MQNQLKILGLAGLCAFLLCGSVSAREVLSLNEGWRFSPTRSTGGRFGSCGWGGGNGSGGGQEVTLPHTWNAEEFMSDQG